MNVESLVAISQRAASAPDAATALRAAAELRQAIASLEVTAVEQALSQGATWSEIAAALGITKQAAHKRYAKRRGKAKGLSSLRGSEPGNGSSAPSRVPVTPGMRCAIRNAQVIAFGLEHEQVEGAHLLLGLLMVDGAAGHALLEIGAAFDRVLAIVQTLELPRAPLDEHRVASATEGHLRLSDAAETAIRQAFCEAARLCHGHLGGEHLLLGLLRCREQTTLRTLRELGVSGPDLERCLGKVLLEWDLAPTKKRSRQNVVQKRGGGRKRASLV